MRWRQFLTPVKSFTSEEVRKLQKNSSDEIQFVDVRQPSEYQVSHIPGARLIPLPQLSRSLDQLDREKPVVVYWAVGGRSRVAAQQLAGEGFSEVINLKGGMKAWNGHEAAGAEDLGLELFHDLQSAEHVLSTAYSLEQGLEDFYHRMAEEVSSPEVMHLFKKLGAVEEIHKEILFTEYSRLTGADDLTAFEEALEKDAVEGGLTTDQYLQRFNPDFEKMDEVIGLAMTIEAQALDLYVRASRNSEDSHGKGVLERIAGEERTHLEQLGSLLDSVLERDNG